MDVSDEAHVDGLIDDLDTSPDWRTGAPAAARQLLGRLPQTPATELQRARLTLLSTHEAVRARDAADAALTIQGVRDLAVRRGHQALEARAEPALSGLFREIGDPSASMEHAVAALALDGDDLAPVLRCRLSLAMADSHASIGSHESARRHYGEALGTAGDLADRLQALGEQDDGTFLLGYVDTVVEVLHARGRSAEAIAMLREGLSTDPADAVVDAADCWLVLAQMERETGDLRASGLSLDVADRSTARDELQELRVHVLGVRAALLAIFEVDGARRESARFRTLSYRDPLTSLLNRRHVDEDLDRCLNGSTSSAVAVAVAMVDLDHFKRVNDACSHEAGDAVLVGLATLLEDAVHGSPDAYAARLGGEEFLLARPGLDLTAAHDWSDIAPGVPVTASLGLATAPEPGQPWLGRAGLLRRADDRVYAAKTRGRNRVEPSIAALEAQARAAP